MRALITGGTGYIGSRLVIDLVAQGVDVHLIYRKSSSFGLLKPVQGNYSPHLYEEDEASLTNIVRAVSPDIVYHLAAYYCAEHRPHDLVPLVESNILFGVRLLDAMVEAGCKRIVVAGTRWQHLSNHQSEPATLYAATKAGQEAIVNYYGQAYGLSTASVLATDTYGPADPRVKLFKLLRDASDENRTLSMSAGEQVLDLVYVDDTVSALCMAGAILQNRDGPSFSRWLIKTERRLKLKDVVEIWKDVSGRKVHILWGARPYRDREVMDPWSVGEVVPGWLPQVCLEEGIERMERDACSLLHQPR